MYIDIIIYAVIYLWSYIQPVTSLTRLAESYGSEEVEEEEEKETGTRTMNKL